MTDVERDRLFELLADRAVFGLNADERTELERLQKQFPGWEKDFSHELAAAAINLSEIDASEELPVGLRTQIFAGADEYFAASNEVAADARGARQAVVETAAKRPFWQWLGWAVAAAACVALAINLWATRFSRTPPDTVQNPPVAQPTPTTAPRLSPDEERRLLLAAATDAVKIPLADPKNATEILGEMVWSNSLQKGYARFDHLPANDIAKETYQLWIVDEAQNPKTPISGGVFDIPAAGATVVPVDPSLVVKKPFMIAVTKEKPGGVVVSAPERIVAVAKI